MMGFCIFLNLESVENFDYFSVLLKGILCSKGVLRTKHLYESSHRRVVAFRINLFPLKHARTGEQEYL